MSWMSVIANTLGAERVLEVAELLEFVGDEQAR